MDAKLQGVISDQYKGKKSTTLTVVDFDGQLPFRVSVASGKIFEATALRKPVEITLLRLVERLSQDGNKYWACDDVTVDKLKS